MASFLENVKFFLLAALYILSADDSLREAKPGGFQTRVFPTLFGKGPDWVADPFGTVPRRCSYLNRLRKRKRTNRENPRTLPAQIGKIPGKVPKEGQKRTKKEGQVQIGKPPRLKHPRLAALKRLIFKQYRNFQASLRLKFSSELIYFQDSGP